jgi:uncharacterized protein
VQLPTLMVIAKQPLAGRVKTRLTPPLSPAEAAAVAGAALRDTLAAVALTPAARRVLVFDGDPTGWALPGFEVIPQVGGGLGDRLGAAFGVVGGPALLVGMDTPQISAARLWVAARTLMGRGTDAVLGPTFDGGYWCVGFRRPVAGAFAGVPMSAVDTCARQRERFSSLGVRWAEVPQLRDVDTFADAELVARADPHTRFARTIAALSH